MVAYRGYYAIISPLGIQIHYTWKMLVNITIKYRIVTVIQPENIDNVYWEAIFM